MHGPGTPPAAAAGARAGGHSSGTCGPSAGCPPTRCGRTWVTSTACSSTPRGRAVPARPMSTSTCSAAGRPGPAPWAGQARATVRRPGGRPRPGSFTAFLRTGRAGWAADPGVKLGALRCTSACPRCWRKTRWRGVARSGPPVALGDEQVAAIAWSGTPRSWSCCTRPVSASASCAGSTSATSTAAAGRSVCSARAARSRAGLPVGIPAARAVAAWLASGRPVVAGVRPSSAMFLVRAREPCIDPEATVRRVVHARIAAAGADGVGRAPLPTPLALTRAWCRHHLRFGGWR